MLEGRQRQLDCRRAQRIHPRRNCSCGIRLLGWRVSARQYQCSHCEGAELRRRTRKRCSRAGEPHRAADLALSCRQAPLLTAARVGMSLVRRAKGFTLIELTVVLAIVGIIGSTIGLL